MPEKNKQAMQGAQEAPAAPANVPPPQPSEADFDTSADEAALSAIEAELNESRAVLDSEFIAVFTEAMQQDEALQNLVFEDPKAFLEKYEADKQAFLEEKITPKLNEANALKENIANKKRDGAIFSLQKDFTSAHPDVSLDELDSFFDEDLPKRKQDELKNLPAREGYEELLKLYVASKGAKEEQALPKKHNSLYIEDTANLSDASTMDLPMNRY